MPLPPKRKAPKVYKAPGHRVGKVEKVKSRVGLGAKVRINESHHHWQPEPDAASHAMATAATEKQPDLKRRPYKQMVSQQVANLIVSPTWINQVGVCF